ncbi:hypothetical protein [Vibrio parahaemolyticus]|uniref:hypothetical protein n=2 Tax=Vibrio parahaemolyticus TaxID=670 RepID=UPI0003E26F26|nr:hypothetical protein [Vibrio parahaemolyticus]EGQ7830716.1 hypothetical protein [Vibrio parahaemolyticus]EGR0257231.1 hypothetical protein [Vibrio parahaemolyticus]EGR3259788.1 hypothetical protein [Vibrio parahaemolyticus]EGR9083726.1 hypothetical protein [Vibrio parahaemolyticus]EHS1223295.1 hypothetical protein [Vibrio parahaemolyticus]
MEILSQYASEIIALCALFLTVYQASSQRRQNRISLKPHLDLFTERHFNNGVGRIEIYLINNGLGPAFIETFEITLGDKNYNAKDALTVLFGNRSDEFNYTELSKGYAIAHNQRIRVLSVNFLAKDWAEVNGLEESISSLELSINYKSVHGQLFSLNE